MTIDEAKKIFQATVYGSSKYTIGEYREACIIYEKHLIDNDKKTQG